MFYGHLTSVTDARSTAVIVASGTRMISRMTVECHYLQSHTVRETIVRANLSSASIHIIWPSVNPQYLLSLSVQLLNLTYSLNGHVLCTGYHEIPLETAQ
jgi:hypothetical protein